ncbi:hypothetical protein C9374_006541 [Naegleria lovaniensis]|uniref:protein-tyrosine-phosphatase n=1 Tax=Naegleria lovaniensis TaxID=51637 RepID=A0AA88KLY0_NAELO|nr:uncharacterized protein C9374_006541 [Naegleria lovaniensis]KAG2379424.1 hypothetical protein C9374_006541 [Naegleria lovaniensis]
MKVVLSPTSTASVTPQPHITRKKSISKETLNYCSSCPQFSTSLNTTTSRKRVKLLDDTSASATSTTTTATNTSPFHEEEEFELLENACCCCLPQSCHHQEPTSLHNSPNFAKYSDSIDSSPSIIAATSQNLTCVVSPTTCNDPALYDTQFPPTIETSPSSLKTSASRVNLSPLNMMYSSEEEFCSRMIDQHHPELLHSIKKEYNALVMDEMVSSGSVASMMDEESFESNLFSAIERLEKKLEKIEKLEQLTTQKPIRYTNLKRKFISMFELGLSLRPCHSSPSLSVHTPTMTALSSPLGVGYSNQGCITPGETTLSSELTSHLASPVESIKDKHRRKVQSYLTQYPDKFGAFLTRKALKYYYKLNQQARYLIPQTKDAHFDATKITGQLWLGDIDDAFNDQGLKEHNISHIVTCVKSLEPIYPEKGYQYLNLHLYDEEDQNIVEMFGVSFDFIDNAIKSGHNVLVHCMKGKSRSASILIAYLMKKNSWTFEYALNFVKSKRTIVQPNAGFERQLLQLEDEIFENANCTPTMENGVFSAMVTSH